MFVDNIDFMLPFARICEGKQTSSWHGTSIQAVQPLPSLSEIDSISDTKDDPKCSYDSSLDDTPRPCATPAFPQCTDSVIEDVSSKIIKEGLATDSVTSACLEHIHVQ